MESMKPCPNDDGSEEHRLYVWKPYPYWLNMKVVKCKCGWTGPARESADAAIAAWNGRTEQDVRQETNDRVEELDDRLKEIEARWNDLVTKAYEAHSLWNRVAVLENSMAESDEGAAVSEKRSLWSEKRIETLEKLVQQLDGKINLHERAVIERFEAFRGYARKEIKAGEEELERRLREFEKELDIVRTSPQLQPSEPKPLMSGGKAIAQLVGGVWRPIPWNGKEEEAL